MLLALALPLALPAALCQALMTLGKRVAWIVPATESNATQSFHQLAGHERRSAGLSVGPVLFNIPISDLDKGIECPLPKCAGDNKEMRNKQAMAMLSG